MSRHDGDRKDVTFSSDEDDTGDANDGGDDDGQGDDPLDASSGSISESSDSSSTSASASAPARQRSYEANCENVTDSDDEAEEEVKDQSSTRDEHGKNAAEAFRCLQRSRLANKWYQSNMVHAIAGPQSKIKHLLVNWFPGAGKSHGCILAAQCLLTHLAIVRSPAQPAPIAVASAAAASSSSSTSSAHFSRPVPAVTRRRKVIVILPASLEANFRENLEKYGLTRREYEKDYFFFSFEYAMLHAADMRELVKDNILIVDEVHSVKTEIKTSENPPTRRRRKQKHKRSKYHSSSFSNSSSSSSSSSSAAAAATATALVASPDEEEEYEMDENGRYVVKGHKAARVFELMDLAWKVIVLTGTLLVNGVSDLYNLGLAFSPDKEQWKSAFPRPSDMNAEELDDEQERALDAAFQCKISFLDPQTADRSMYPTTTKENLIIEMDPAYLQQYKRIEQEQITKRKLAKKSLSADERRDVLDQLGKLEAPIKSAHSGDVGKVEAKREAFYMGLRQAVNGIDGFPSRKLEFIVDLAKRLHRRHETMTVHSFFREKGIDRLAPEFDRSKIPYAQISGKVKSMQRRQKCVHLFNRGRRVTVLLLTKAGSTGIDLKGASAHVNVETAWTLAEREQADARTDRYGSHKHKPVHLRHVVFYNLFLAKPEDVAVYERRMLQDKRDKRPGAPDVVRVFRYSQSAASTPGGILPPASFLPSEVAAAAAAPLPIATSSSSSSSYGSATDARRQLSVSQVSSTLPPASAFVAQSAAMPPVSMPVVMPAALSRPASDSLALADMARREVIEIDGGAQFNESRDAARWGGAGLSTAFSLDPAADFDPDPEFESYENFGPSYGEDYMAHLNRTVAYARDPILSKITWKTPLPDSLIEYEVHEKESSVDWERRLRAMATASGLPIPSHVYAKLDRLRTKEVRFPPRSSQKRRLEGVEKKKRRGKKKADDDDDEKPLELPALDLLVYDLQQRKARAIAKFMASHIPRWSIEQGTSCIRHVLPPRSTAASAATGPVAAAISSPAASYDEKRPSSSSSSSSSSAAAAAAAATPATLSRAVSVSTSKAASFAPRTQHVLMRRPPTNLSRQWSVLSTDLDRNVVRLRRTSSQF